MEDIKPRDFADLWAFVRVVDAGSFSAAARQLGTTTANISKGLARLEQALQARLLHRSTRRIGLTEAGQLVYGHALRMIDEGKAIEAAVAGLQTGPSGTLRVTTSLAFGNTQLAGLLPGFMARYPDVRVVLGLTDRHVDLVEEGFDLALRLTPEIRILSAVARPIVRLNYVLVAAPAYLARHGSPATLEALAGHRCLLYGDALAGTWSFTVDGQIRQLRLEGRLAANSSQSLRAAMLGGAGIALLPTFVVGKDLASGAALRVLPQAQPHGPFGDFLHAVYLENRFLPQKVRVFIDYLVEQLGEGPPWDGSPG